VRCTCAAHDCENNVDFGTSPELAMALPGGCIYRESFVRCGRRCVPCSIPIPLSKSFNRGVSSAAVCVSGESRFEKSDEVGFVCRGSQRGGEYLGREDGRA
jgi:hypothetical protein